MRGRDQGALVGWWAATRKYVNPCPGHTHVGEQTTRPCPLDLSSDAAAPREETYFKLNCSRKRA